MGSYVLPKGNSSKAREIRGSSTRQEDNCSCISRFSLYCVLVQPLWHITNFPYSQQSSITEYFQSHHKELLWTGKNLVLIIRAGWIIQLSSKANKRNMSWRCSSRSSNTVFAQRPPELCPIQLHSTAGGGLFSRGRDRCQNTGGSGEECFVVCQNEF